MADNVETQSATLATIPASTTIATEDEGGVHYQKIKLTASASGSTEALSKAEDTAHTSGEHGILALAIRSDTLGTAGHIAGTAGDYIGLQTDAVGATYTRETWKTPLGDTMADDTNDALRVHVVADSVSGATATDDGEIAADTASCAVAIAPQYVKGVAHGTNPTGITANARVLAIGNRAGIPFTMAGHPNLITKTFTVADSDDAETDVAITGAIGAGTKVIVTYIKAKTSPANSGNTTLRVGFGAANTPAAALAGTTGLLIDGTYGAFQGETLGTGAGIVGIGADGEELRFTCSDPAGGHLYLTACYYTVES